MAKSKKKADKRDNAQTILRTGGEDKTGIDQATPAKIFTRTGKCAII